MTTRHLLTAVLAVALMAAPATADWFLEDGHKMHHPQLPDLSPAGMDVLAGLTAIAGTGEPLFKVLADDFMCMETGLITDIHIWGSWLDDQFPTEPHHGTFVLGIYDDIPAGTGGVQHSRPGQLLWDMKFKPAQYQVRLEALGPEHFYDPNLDEIIGADDTAWQYNFFIDQALAFQQEAGKIYWLSVLNVDPNYDGVVDLVDLQLAQTGINRFGWKTSRDHWNDDAVYIDMPVEYLVEAIIPPPGLADWYEMRYPAPHPLEGQSIDLAFVITPEPASLVLMTLGTLAVLRRR